MRYCLDTAARLAPSSDLVARDLLTWGGWGFACGAGLGLPILQLLGLLGDLRHGTPSGVKGNFLVQLLARLHKSQQDVLAGQLRSYISWGLVGAFIGLSISVGRVLISWGVRTVSSLF